MTKLIFGQIKTPKPELCLSIVRIWGTPGWPKRSRHKLLIILSCYLHLHNNQIFKTEPQARQMKLDLSDIKVIYEDNHLIAVNKPAGWLVQGDQTGDTPLSDYVKEYIKFRYKKEGNVFLGVVHRIDRPVSGVVVFARTSKGLSRMNKLFQDGKVKKTYWAVVKERPENLEGKLVHYLIKDHKRNQAKAFDKLPKKHPKAKRSELAYKLTGSLGNFHLLEVKPKTGRPHQIRVQLARMGSPIKGDIKYGYPNANHDASIHLHAKKIEFEHPVKKEPITIEADPPDDQVWNKFV